MRQTYKTIAFQGMPGAFSELASKNAFPDLETIPCISFEATFHAVYEKKADLAIIPVDNSLAGRVADVHHLIPHEQLYIIGEHFELIRHCLLGVSGATLQEITDAHSHVHAIPQCKQFLDKHGIKKHTVADTAKAAADVKKWNDPTQAAISSEYAASIYGLNILQKDIQDDNHNTTRFLIFAPEKIVPKNKKGDDFLTSIIFEVRNIPAALYKALGGFATNGVQMVKLESYVDKDFKVARFYADIEGHIENHSVQLAMQELNFFAKRVVVMGTYKAHPFRRKGHSLNQLPA